MVLDDPVSGSEVPPDVEVEYGELGDEAFRADSDDQEYDGREAHGPKLQDSDQLLLQAHRNQRQIRH